MEGSRASVVSPRLLYNHRMHIVIPAKAGIQYHHPTWIPYQVRNDRHCKAVTETLH